MSKEGIIEEVISPLLKQLANAKRPNTQNQENGISSDINRLLEKIERVVQDMKDVSRRAESWERDVKDKFGDMAQLIDDISEDADNFHGIQSKLHTIVQEIGEIKDHASPLLEPLPIESRTPPSSSSQPSTAEFRKRSNGWLQFKLEEKILGSPAMKNLQVSYENLDLQLKLCSFCFSIFPEDSIIKKRQLIYWWIGEGLITPTRHNTAEEIGERCFRELIGKGLIEPYCRKCHPIADCLIQPICRECCQIADCCKLHPWIRRMLISVAKGAQFFDFDPEGNPTADFSKSRRACLPLVTPKDESSQETRKNNRAAELLTLFNVNEHYLKFEKGLFAEMRKVAVLQLGRWQTSAKHHIEVENTKFLEGLGSLKLIRYLSLQGISRIIELPSSIGKLSNLRILDLRACHNLEKLTVGITSLKKLTHLDVSECYLLDHMPKGLGSLSELQVLKGFVVGNSRSKDPCRLSELAKLEKLRKLSINIGSNAVVTEGEFELGQFRALCSLTIIWGVVSLHSNEGNEKKTKPQMTRTATMTLTSLSLPPILNKLDLRCFPSETSPQWLKPSNLKNLKKLYIRGGKLVSLYRPGDGEETWKVEVLRLKNLSKMKMECSDLKAAFPHLAYLEIFKCEVIKCEKMHQFPCHAAAWGSKEGQIAGPSNSSNTSDALC